MPSPSSCSDSAVTMIASPGNSTIQQRLVRVLLAARDHRAPGRDLRRHADAEEGQRRFGQDRVGEDEGALHQ